MRSQNVATLSSVILGIVIFFLGLSFLGFIQSIRPPRILSDITPQDLGLEYEDLTLKTSDGLHLSAWFIPHLDPQNQKSVILLHGYPADKGNILPFMSFLHRDYNLLLFDFRGLGSSQGKISTAGAHEVLDLRAAVDELRSRGIDKVGVWGFSMGGAVALMTAPTVPEITAVVAESPYARLDLMAQQLYRLPLLRHPLGWLTGIWARVNLGIDPAKVAPSESAEKLKIPVLLIHSKMDTVIPFSDALMIQESLKGNPNAEFWFPERLVHGQISDEHQRRITDFFHKHL